MSIRGHGEGFGKEGVVLKCRTALCTAGALCTAPRRVCQGAGLAVPAGLRLPDLPWRFSGVAGRPALSHASELPSMCRPLVSCASGCACVSDAVHAMSALHWPPGQKHRAHCTCSPSCRPGGRGLCGVILGPNTRREGEGSWGRGDFGCFPLGEGGFLDYILRVWTAQRWGCKEKKNHC